MKRILIGILIGMLLSVPIYSIADTVSKIGKKVETEVTVTLDGKELETKGIAIEGISYLPIRTLSEAVGIEVGYNAEKKVVELTTPANEVVLEPIQEPIQQITQQPANTPEFTLEYVEMQISKLNLDIRICEDILENSTDQKQIETAREFLPKYKAELAKWEAIKAGL